MQPHCDGPGGQAARRPFSAGLRGLGFLLVSLLVRTRSAGAPFLTASTVTCLPRSFLWTSPSHLMPFLCTFWPLFSQAPPLYFPTFLAVRFYQISGTPGDLSAASPW